MRTAIRKSNGKSQPIERDIGGVQSVDRALHLIEALSEDCGGYRLTDLAVRTGLSTSTTHRLLTTLEKRHFVYFDRVQALWHVGARCFSVGAAFAGRQNIVAQAMPFLHKLRDQSRETANLAVLDRGSVIILARVESREIMRSVTKLGGRVPMAASGLGKALLATYAEDDVHEVIRREGMPRFTSRSIVRAGALSKSLHEVRERGYSIDDEEAQVGLRCVSAVVRDHSGDAFAAISLSGKASRVSDDRLDHFGKLVSDAATQITQSIALKLSR